MILFSFHLEMQVVGTFHFYLRLKVGTDKIQSVEKLLLKKKLVFSSSRNRQYPCNFYYRLFDVGGSKYKMKSTHYLHFKIKRMINHYPVTKKFDQLVRKDAKKLHLWYNTIRKINGKEYI